MALNKSITLDNGIVLNYHRVVSVTNITNHESIIEVGSYLNKEQRDREKQWYKNPSGDINVFINAKYYSTEYNKDLNVNNAYEYLKTLDEFKDAEDVFEIADEEIETIEPETTEEPVE